MSDTMSNWQHLAQRSMASRFLDIVKMKSFVPCEVEAPLTGYKAKIVQVVFDPLKMEEVNESFRQSGYYVGDGMNVIAVMDDRSILLLGNSAVSFVGKNEKIQGVLDDSHVAFYDIMDLTRQFKIKNKKTEIDELVVKLKAKHDRSA